jgi:hypothetical protein
MVVRMYGYAQDSSGTGSAMSSPAGWTSRANLFTNVSGAFQCAIVVAELINGTGNVNITASSTGGWMVADAAIAISPFSVRSPVRVNQAVKRAAYY